jgi:glyoxylate/hydroxypyruvate reductase
MAFLFKSDPPRGAIWARIFAERLPELPFHQWPDIGDPEKIRFMTAWTLPDDLACFPNLELLFSVGAGVDQLDLARLPPHLPVVRMIEPGLIAGMVEYVTLSVLALHRRLPHYLDQQREGVWQSERGLPASSTRVGVMGLGVLGQAALKALGPFGFPLRGWSRSMRALPGVACCAGQEALPDFLAGCDVLVCLPPLTVATRGLLDARLFAALPRGAGVVNAGRGGHLVMADLLAALESGQVSAAILDVSDPEPPPARHPFWSYPRIWLTPHIASTTQAESGADAIIGNIRRHLASETPVGLIDRVQGY